MRPNINGISILSSKYQASVLLRCNSNGILESSCNAATRCAAQCIRFETASDKLNLSLSQECWYRLTRIIVSPTSPECSGVLQRSWARFLREPESAAGFVTNSRAKVSCIPVRECCHK
jgi:hypothetical protein